MSKFGFGWRSRLCFMAVAMWSLAAAHAAGVRQFSPQGEADAAVRATAVFSVDMVPLGQAEAPPPFAVDCGEVRGRGRWANTKSWTYTLERPLQPGERCDFRLRPEVRSSKGETLSGEPGYAFFAPGPWPRTLTPRPGSTIEEEQVFLIEANGELQRASVASNVWCEADGTGNRIPVRVLDDDVRDRILATLQRSASAGTLALTCAERLPSGRKMQLVWGRGVAARNGAIAQRSERFPYLVRTPFEATFTCERERANAPCSPLSEMRIELPVPVDAKLALRARLVTPDGRRAPAVAVGEGERENTLTAITFKPPFAQNAEMKIELPADLKDEAGRPLSNAASFPLTVRTGALPPLAKFPGAFGILELHEGGILPVTLRNVEASLPLADLKMPSADAHRYAERRLTDDAQVIAALHALVGFERQTKHYVIGTGDERRDYDDPYYARELSFLGDKAGVERRALPKPGGSGEFEVVGIPLTKPGFHVVEIESKLLGSALLTAPKPMYVRTSALVTNMAVHFKRGQDNALVWVTALDSGKPVAGAEVRISDCAGTQLWQGRSDALGRALVGAPLAPRHGGDEACPAGDFLFVSARLGDDYSFARSDWNEGIEPWRFGVETWGEYQPRKIHTVLDRSLLRAGQTVSMKHIARERNSQSYAYPAVASLPNVLVIRHEGSGDEFRLPLVWDARGVATSQWRIPDAAKRGSYQVELVRSMPPGSRKGSPDDGAEAPDRYAATQTAEFRVSDFRLPVFSGSVQGVPGRQIAPSEVPLALGLSFLNGGAAQGAKVEVSATVRPRWPEYKHYEAFQFLVGFDDEALQAFQVDDGREREQLIADKIPLTLDRAGAGQLKVALPTAIKGPSELYAEMTFADPNGEIQTVHGSVELSPSAVVAGMRVEDWASVRERGRIEVVTLDTQGQPVADAPVRIVAKRRIDYSHRKRIVGGFYAYEHHSEFADLGVVCSGRSDAQGKFRCEMQSDEPGSVYLLAETSDAAGHRAYAGSSFWVAGNGDLWFTAGNQDRIDVIPEKRSYRPGETARLQVRTPFREATALVSVEAAGIVETQVVTLSRFNPVIELPVKGEWGPNVFVSVLAVRGRVQPLKWYSFFSWGWREPAAWFREWWNPSQPTAMVDLARPAYKIGLAALDVGVDAFRLKVDVTPEKTDYAPRDSAAVRVKVTLPDGKPAPAGSEVAFAAVDQALLELRANDSWNLLDAMLPRRAYQVETATAQSQVVGKRHFGKKAVPPGGGGGRAPARELFDTLLLWNPRVVLDANGSALVRVPLNDALSEFKLVAVADVGTGLFGSGSASLRTRQDLQLISGLPPLVREKDRYRAQLTVRNATARAMTVQVSGKAGERALPVQDVHIDAEGAAEVAWMVDAPEGVDTLAWEFAASEQVQSPAAAGVRDKLRITQTVAPAVPVSVQQAAFERIDGSLSLPAAAPRNALSGSNGTLGGVEVALSAKLSTPPPGLRRYFAEYPFACLEQQVSVALGLHDAARWQRIVDALPTYLDSHGLARYFPGEARGNAGSPALTAYLLDVSQAVGANDFAIPPALVERMERGLIAFAEGRIKPEYWSPQNDLVARKLMAIEALTRRGQQPLSALSSLDVDTARLPTSALIDWYLVARRLNALPDRAARLAEVQRELRNRLSYQGGRLVFTSETSDYWWWLMLSGDMNAFRLIEAVLDDAAWAEDLPALVRGAMLRQQRGRWLTTTANTWATIALARYGQAFERDPVSGTTSAVLGDGKAQVFTWSAAGGERGNAAATTAEPSKAVLPWPAGGDTLRLTHSGGGRPWAAMQVLAAVPVKDAVANGLRVTRQVTPLQEKRAGAVSRGDVWRVRLTVESEQEVSWVVLSDPIPAGARILGDGDGRDSAIAAGDQNSGGGAWPAFIERTFGTYRAYYGYVPRGTFNIEYTLRLNNAGEFSLPATRVEAMYAPEIFGEAPNAKLVVGD